MGLHGSQLSAFNTVYAEIKKELPPPILLIHLQCDPKIELERIRARGRDVEKNITVDFLSALNRAVSEQIENTKDHIRILSIDSAKYNFADDVDVKKKLRKMVANSLQ
jgi:deoxyadenosine/deoxycytidine kinase